MFQIEALVSVTVSKSRGRRMERKNRNRIKLHNPASAEQMKHSSPSHFQFHQVYFFHVSFSPFVLKTDMKSTNRYINPLLHYLLLICRKEVSCGALTV